MSTAAHLPESDVLIQFDENAFEPVNAYQEDFEDQVHVAQEQLAALREKQELLERQKRELEELQEKKKEFTEGRTRLVKELADYIELLDHESTAAVKRSEQCLDTRDLFDHQLRVLQSLRPEQWGRNELASELSRAIESIETAEEEIADAAPVLQMVKAGSQPKSGIFNRAGAVAKSAHSKVAAHAGEEHSFGYWFKSGLAFTLPVMIFVGIVGLVMCLFGG